jgi:hypothetical protein
MNLIVILGTSAIVLFIGILIICYFGIRKCLRKIKECNEGMQRCAENAVKDPNDFNWAYLGVAWCELRLEQEGAIWLIGFLIVICLGCIGYIGYML